MKLSEPYSEERHVYDKIDDYAREYIRVHRFIQHDLPEMAEIQSSLFAVGFVILLINVAHLDAVLPQVSPTAQEALTARKGPGAAWKIQRRAHLGWSRKMPFSDSFWRRVKRSWWAFQ